MMRMTSARYLTIFSVIIGTIASVIALPSLARADYLPDDPGHETIHEASTAIQEIAEKISRIGFLEIEPTAKQIEEITSIYSYVDPRAQVPPALLSRALSYYHANLDKIENKNYLTVADYSQHSSKARFYVVNMNTGSVWAIHVAHGKGSDPSNSGYATRFSNLEGSEQTSLGYYLTAETYNGEHGLSLRIDGLSSTNSNVRKRDIVVHGASYVSDSNLQAGRSWGCFAVPFDDRSSVVESIKGGSLIFASGPSLE
jgi:hypothetical protein